MDDGAGLPVGDFCVGCGIGVVVLLPREVVVKSIVNVKTLNFRVHFVFMEDIIAELSQNPLSSIFLLSVVCALVLRKLYQLHITLTKAEKQD